jgi:hypothetical protein
MIKELSHCRLCGNTDLISVLSLGNQHLTGVFPRAKDERLTCGPLELVKCHGDKACGLLQLRHSYGASEMYGANYGYRSGLNQSMVEHLKAKVRANIQRAGLADGDLVLDIGSNDGTLLSFYPEGPTRVGMDPTSAKFRKYYKPGIEVVSDFFSAAEFQRHFGDRKAKIVTSIAMLYDLEDPIAFAGQVAAILEDDGIWHFEQSYMPTMLKVNAYDTICHEHLEYYGLAQIEWIMNRCGLKIIDVELNDINGGSFAVTVAKAGSSRPVNSAAIRELLDAERSAGMATPAPYEAFAKRVFEHRDRLLAMLAELRAKGSTILGYGASTKGNVILQFCGITPEQIPFIAEVNPDKFGCVTPGSWIPIISEQEAHAMKPDYLLALPWHFRDNLLQREATFLGRGGKMIFPLPGLVILPGRARKDVFQREAA